MKIKKILCLCLASMMVLGGCQSAPQETAEETKKEEDATVRLGVLKIGDSLPLYMGDQEGIFEKNGAKVEIIEFGSASDQSKAMESGAIDGMMTDMIVQSLIQKGGVEMRTVATALGATAQDGKFIVAANSEAGITEPKDLAGKKIAISEGTMMEYLIDSYCEELNIDEASVEKVNIPNLSLRFETLMSGEVDAAILPDPLGDVALQNGAVCVIDDTTLEKNFSRSVIALNNEFIEAHPETVKNFIAGYNESIDRLNEHKEEDLPFVYSVAKVPEPLQGKWSMPNFVKNVVPTEEEVERVLDWMVKKELIDEKAAYDQVVNPAFCKEAE